MSNTTMQVRQTQDVTNKGRSALTYTPRFDIWEDETAFHLTGDLPGISTEQLDIQYEDGELRIWGQVAPPQQELDYWSQEYGVGDFYRSFSVGEAIDGERIEAVMKDGVLELTLPKHPSVRPRRIEVKTG